MERLSKTGLVIPDRVPWGTHLCQFYETKDDLLEILVPYFREGIAAGESCLWITSNPISVEEASNALRAAVADLNQYLAKGLTAYLEQVRDNGSFVGELMARRKDGSMFQVEVLGSMTFDDRGRPIGTVASCFDLTARREAEARRQESETRYQTLVENVALGITLMDRNHKILAVNGAHARRMDRPLEKCIGHECYRVFEKREAVCPHCPGTRAMETRKPEEVEIVGVRDDGTTYAARVQAFPVYSGQGGVDGFIEVVEDITDRKMEQDALRRANFCVEQASECIFWIDPGGQIVFANQKACEALEYSREELMAATVFDIDPWMTREQWAPHWEEIREKKSFVIESRHRTKSGNVFPVEVSVNAMTFDGREYNCAFVRDISERKETEKQLAHFSAIVSSSQDGIIGVSLDGFITSWNHGAEQLYGYTAAETIRQPVSMLLPLERFDETSRLLERVKRGGRIEHFDTVRRRKDGTPFDVSVTYSPIKDNNGHIIGASAIARDITDRKRTERELLHAKTAAEAASRAKSEFLANMSHEIRTPMTAILGFSDLLLAAAADEETSEACQIIKRNGEHLLHVINDILDLSKIEAGKHDMEFQSCSLQQLVSDVLSTMQVRADAKGLPLSVEFRGIFPDRIQTAPIRLRQILINLIGNAVKFTETGSVRVVVQNDATSSEARRIRFDIVDTGIGIAEDHVATLFQPFSQVDGSAGRRFGGTGLGLAISRRLAQMLGGDITVSSVLGEGTTFTVTIEAGTLSDADSPRPRAVTAERNGSPADGPTALNCRILLVEDGPDNQRLIGFLLRKAGAEVTVVEDGKQAIEHIFREEEAGRSFDVILMDMQMPVLDGYGATRKLRGMGYQGPIIALTAHAMREDRQKCLDAGCDDYLTKPVNREEMLQLVAKVTAEGSRSEAPGCPIPEPST